MNNPNFLTTSDLSVLHPVDLDGRPVLSAETFDKLEAAGGGAFVQIADLFAEPALGPAAEQGVRNAAWYARFAGTSQALNELPGEQRELAEADLRTKLARLGPLLTDLDVGPLLGRALLIPDLNSVRIIGNHAVLINWGVVPPEVGGDETAQVTHFGATLGKYCDFDVPWRMSTDSPATESTAQHMAEPQSTATRAVATPPVGDIPVNGSRDAVTPWYRSTGFVAFYASLVFALGVLVGWLFKTDSYDAGLPPGLDTGEVQRGINNSLRNEIDKLRRMLDGDVCQMPTTDYFNPQVHVIDSGEAGADREARIDGDSDAAESGDPGTGAPTDPGDSVPDDEADTAESTANAVGRESDAAKGATTPTIRELLEKSVAMVLAPAGKKSSMGTGFFIGPDTLVTNRHVIEKGDPNRLLVVSEQLGSVIRARAIAQSPTSELYQRDYAVLRLEKPVAPATLALAPKVEKLSRVFLGGYPGALMQTDPQFEALMKGDTDAAPDMVMSPGDVVVVQHPKSGVPVVVHTAFMLQGNSGGALLDTCGRVVGINTFISQDKASGRGASWSLGSSDLIEFLSSNNVTVDVDPADCTSGVR